MRTRARKSLKKGKRKTFRKKRKKQAAQATAIWDGLMKPPPEPNSIGASFLYPFWGASGVSLLVILPPLLWITSVPFVTILIAFGGNDTPLRVPALCA